MCRMSCWYLQIISEARSVIVQTMLLSEQLEVCVSADTRAKNLEPAEKERLFSLLHQLQYTMRLQTKNIKLPCLPYVLL